MKRWLVILLVLLAVIVLISPGIIGRMAEQNMDESIAWAENENPGIDITTETFERSWFTSAGRHRIVFEGGQFSDIAQKYTEATGNPDLFSLIIDTHVDHGLLPLTSLTRESGSLMPGLASTVSTFQVDPGNGELVALPGKLYSNVSLAGASDSRFLLEPGSYEKDALRVSWEGADLRIHMDRSSGAMSVHGSVSPWSISDDNGVATFGVITIAADQRRSGYGFNVGPVDVAVDQITVDADSESFTIGGIRVNGDSSISAGRLNSVARFTISDVVVPDLGNVAMTMDMDVTGLDAASLGAVVKVLKEAQAADDPEAAMAGVFPAIEGDLQTLAASGGGINFRQFDITLPQGTIATKIAVDVAAADASAAFSWPGVLLAMTASMDLRVPAEIFDMASMMNPQAGSLLAMGILQKDGDEYVMAAEYARGLINVNGVPMPIPIPGL